MAGGLVEEEGSVCQAEEDHGKSSGHSLVRMWRQLLVWCVATLALSGSFPRMSVPSSGRRVWVEEKPLFRGGWLRFLDHL